MEMRLAAGTGPGRKISGKSEFPATLSDDEIIAGVEQIANDPSCYPAGSIPTGPDRLKISGSVKGTRTTVIVEPGTGDVITAWPEGLSRNP
jgi:hypothetical protein